MTLNYDVSGRQKAITNFEEIQAYRLAGYYAYEQCEPLAVTRARNSTLAWIAVTQHFNSCGMRSIVPYEADIAIKQLTRGAKSL
jgi:hypothetical protein